jgi:hypothetical protein
VVENADAYRRVYLSGRENGIAVCDSNVSFCPAAAYRAHDRQRGQISLSVP